MKNIFLCIAFSSIVFGQTPCSLGAPYDCADVNFNSLSYTVDNNGTLRRFYFPAGKNLSLFNQAQLMIGAKINGRIRYAIGWAPVPQSDYSPGPLIDGKPDSVKENFTTKYKVFRIAKNWEQMREGPDKDEYRNDYNNWPDELGAPADAEGKPRFLGDVTTWCVWNDVDTLNHYFSEFPLGAEIQMTTWEYTNDPILRNMVFVKYTIINKSDTSWNDFFAGNYLYGGIAGSPTFAGIDSSLELQYLYSSRSSVAGYGVQIPAFGYIALQGPVVPKPGGTAFDLGRFLPDAENLRIHGGSTEYVPFDSLIYNEFLGLQPYFGIPYINPVTGKTTTFTYTGDPIYNSGWTEQSSGVQAWSTREIMLSTGPIDVNPGDTVSLVGAFIAGQGKSNLQSIAILKYFARYIKGNYVNLFSPSSVPSPNISTSVLSGKIILTWGNEAEHTLVNGYKFQGYNIYQGESEIGPWHRIASSDLNDNVSILTEEEYQPEFLSIASRGIQVLDNKGLQHHLIVVRDSINQSPIINGRPYYFSVRGIWENNDLRPIVVESPASAVTAVAEDVVPGSHIVDPLTLLPHDRRYDDAVQVEVIDPLKLKNNSYKVVIHNVHDTITWDLLNTTANSIVLSNQKSINGEPSEIIDGLTVRLKKQLPGIRRDQQTPHGWEYIPSSHRWMTGAVPTLIMDGFFNGLVYPTHSNYYGRGGSSTPPEDLKRIEIRFDRNVPQKAYRYLDKARGFPFFDPPKDPSFAPYIINQGNGYVYQDFVDVPFTVWEIDSTDGDLTPRQLTAGFVETNDSLYSSSGKYLGRGKVDGKWEPLASPSGGGEILYIFSSPYSPAPEARYQSAKQNLYFTPDSFDIMYILAARADTTLKKSNKFSFEDGDIFRITPNYQLPDGRTFSFTSTPGIVGSKQLAIEQKAMEKINVFPNPYLGGHSLEQSAAHRFVRITHLPAPSTIRIFTLSGRLIRTFEHINPNSGMEDWDLRNDEGIAVASGLYIIHIESPGIGTKVLKITILRPDERIRSY